MTDLFSEYELLAQSSTFDAEYYVRVNADVAATSIDPLMLAHRLFNVNQSV